MISIKPVSACREMALGYGEAATWMLSQYLQEKKTMKRL
uniref:Uncharacterized protein n=1 Tax=Rhizophora mucronata TaxID=61149 RepID=A0A2P2PLH7_RHIMU